MSFQPEPTYRHGQPPRTAVLLVNLGTPDKPTAPALRRYLREFLSDPRVVEIPRALWWLILHGIILRTRPARSAAKYASVHTASGEPSGIQTVAYLAAERAGRVRRMKPCRMSHQSARGISTTRGSLRNSRR